MEGFFVFSEHVLCSHVTAFNKTFSLHLLNISAMKVIDTRVLNSIFVRVVFWCTQNFILIQCKYVYFTKYVRYFYCGTNLSRQAVQLFILFWAILCESCQHCKGRMLNFQPIVLLHSMIGYWQRPLVRLSVCLSVTLCIVALRVGVRV